MRRSVPLVLLVLALVAAACSGDDDTDSAANTSIPDETTTSSTTDPEPDTVAPDVIPTDESLIDEAYVEGVLAGLADASAEAFDATRTAGVVDERAQAITLATSTPPDAARGLNALARLARSGFDGYREDPDPTRYTVLKVHTASRKCIVAEISIDASGSFIDPTASQPPPGRTMVELLPATAEQRSSGLNPTAWVSDSFPVVKEDDDLPDCAITQ